MIVTFCNLTFGQTLYESFTDGDFTANPVWVGNTSSWIVVANSDAAAGVTGSNTLRLSAPAASQTDYLSSQISSWDASQEWGFFLGRRAQALTSANQAYFWLYANESNLTSATVDGYRIAIGDDSGDDQIKLEYIVDGAVSSTVINPVSGIANARTDYGILVRVTRSSIGDWEIYTSTLPASNGVGAIATDIPNSTNANISQGTGNNNSLIPSTNGYIGVAALHSTAAIATASTEFDQIYFTTGAPCSGASTGQASFNTITPAATTADINLTAGTGGTGRVVKINTTNSFTDLTDGDDPTATLAYGGGEQVVYNGAGSGPFTVTGLSASTTYYLAVYEYNCSVGRFYFSGGTSPGTDNFTTLAAPAIGLQITAADTEYKIDFDNTVANVNEGQYDGSGFTTSPATGQLNSNAWATTGMSDGDGPYGGSYTTGDFARSTSTGGETTGGFYAFTVDIGNNALGIQPGGSDWNPGTITLRIQNKTGGVISTLGLLYKVFIYNNEDRFNSFNFSYSTDDVTYTPNAGMDFTSIETADISPEWKGHLRSLLIPGLSVADGDYIYIRWSGETLGGVGSQDEFALDDISIVANPGTVNQSFSGSLEAGIIAANTALSGSADFAESISLMGAKLIVNDFDVSATSVFGGTAAAYVRTNGLGSLIMKGITTPFKDVPVGNATYNPLGIDKGSGMDWSVRVEDVVDNVIAPYSTDLAINRTWHISPSGPLGPTPDIIFNFDDADASQLVNETAYNLAPERTVDIWHYYNGSWVKANPLLSMTGSNGPQSLTMTGVSTFSPFAISKTSSPLPVSLVSFAGQKEGNANKLRWSTASESNNLGFEVLRSTDGINYAVIGFVNSIAIAGNSSDILSYSFIDNNISKQKYYYRLRQVDFDNRGTLSLIVVIKGEKPLITGIDGVFPNPANTNLNVLIAAPEKSNLTLVLTDMAGRMIAQKAVNVEVGSNTIPIDISSFNKGTYIVRLVCKNGCEASARFIKL